jgi:hypothetical protein
VVRAALALVVLGCGGGANGAGDAPAAVTTPAVVAAPPADAAVATPDAAIAVGDGLVVTVTWTKVAAALRNSPGRTSCNTPRAAQVSPTTMWGIPEAMVVVDGAPATTGDAAAITLGGCAFTPRLVAAGSSLTITSATLRPARVTVTRRGTVAQLEALADGETPLVIQLPIAGHSVVVPLEAGAVYELATDDAKDPETAWVIAGAGAAVTDATGQATFPNVAAGALKVTAWIPPRGGRPAKLAQRPGARGELTIDFGK